MPFFNTTGPVEAEKHYCLPPLKRWDLNEILSLIDQEKYFVLHAPRQTGKTSCLLALMEYLNQSGKYRCMYCNVEGAQVARENVKEGIRAILSEMADAAHHYLNDPFLEDRWYAAWQERGEYDALKYLLGSWAKSSSLPLVVLIDEIDTLQGDTLISVLRQLRAGYARRPNAFPHTVVLCGVRDVRNYRVRSKQDKAIITGGSAFNVKAESLRLGDFSQQDVVKLLHQHTESTGQTFEEAALHRVWYLSQGQPWLVNALAYTTCFKMSEGRDRTHPITETMVLEAKEQIVVHRQTHIDQLLKQLEEERVRRVMEPFLKGESMTEAVEADDLQYLADLGLIRRNAQGFVVANPIYQEVIPRELTYVVQSDLDPLYEPQWYRDPQSGRLDMRQLLDAFQQFFREHSEHWVDRFQYKEAGPQLLMQAFLQRIVNGGGRVEREYGLGRKRTDLLVLMPTAEGTQKVVIELKVLHKSREATQAEGVQQTSEYMDRCGTSEGYLVMFDRNLQRSWKDKCFFEEVDAPPYRIGVYGM